MRVVVSFVYQPVTRHPPSIHIIHGGIMKLILLLFLVSMGRAQVVHDIPFGSSRNVIELTIENSTEAVHSLVRIAAQGNHPWLRLDETEQILANLRPGEHHPVRFTFDVHRSAPVSSAHTLTLLVSVPGGQTWSREVTMRVSPPRTAELFQNYPNPFNPTTTIGYQLPWDASVSLRVFNLIGQEVDRVVEGNRTAGYHEERWDAAGQASGMYLYQIIATGEDGSQYTERRMMTLVR
jgi:hypothetical protein